MMEQRHDIVLLCDCVSDAYVFNVTKELFGRRTHSGFYDKGFRGILKIAG